MRDGTSASTAGVRVSSRPPTAQAFVLAELRRAIVSGDLKPGQPLRQDALATRFGVSRVPLREALKALEGEGQVVYEPHRGYQVARLSLDDLLEVYRIRSLLEAEAARRAVERAGDDVVVRMRELAAEVDLAGERGDVVAMTEANRHFHFALVAAAGMPRLERIVRVLWEATDAYRAVYYGDEANRRRVAAEHAAIVQALAARDAERLVRLIDEHRQHAVDALSLVLSGQ